MRRSPRLSIHALGILLATTVCTLVPAPAGAKTPAHCRDVVFDGAAGDGSLDTVTFRIIDKNQVVLDESCLMQVVEHETATHFTQRVPVSWGDGRGSEAPMPSCPPLAYPTPGPTPPGNKTCGSKNPLAGEGSVVSCKHTWKIKTKKVNGVPVVTNSLRICCYESLDCTGKGFTKGYTIGRGSLSVQTRLNDPIWNPTPAPSPPPLPVTYSLSQVALDPIAMRQPPFGDLQGCRASLGKAVAAFTVTNLQAELFCHDINLKLPGSCVAPDPEVIAKSEDALKKAANGYCAAKGTPASFGYGTCPGGGGIGDWDAAATCFASQIGTAIDVAVDDKYDPTVLGPLLGDDLRCQVTVGDMLRYLTSVHVGEIVSCQKGVDASKVTLPSADPLCRDADLKGKRALAEQKATARIEEACSIANVPTLKICEPDQVTAPAVAICVVQNARTLAEAVANAVFTEGAPPTGICGNGYVDQVNEECDGNADSACPGLCGGPTSFFPCLCQDRQRQRVIEHAGADVDLGWSGAGHDAGVVEGSGYVTDLWDCDGPGGPDTLCTVGPSCSLAPHSTCVDDATCSGLSQGLCRKTAGGATGPHCQSDVQQPCASDLDCAGGSDRCIFTPHGPPIPIAAGGVALCVQSAFAEDVVGTTDLATGASAVRQRERKTTYLAADQSQPCPICGGFCAGSAGITGPSARTQCASDADCPNPPNHCTLDPVCSWGPNINKPCRPNAPFGGPTALFGTPSVDCPFPSVPDVGQLDVLMDPFTTGPSTLPSSFACTDPGFNGMRCLQGANAGAPCTVASACPGGSCVQQCFCPPIGGAPEKPNACAAACVNGAFDAQPCTSDLDCSGGVCRPGDCRPNLADMDSAQEGSCTAGPISGRCSVHSFRSCTLAGDCTPPACPYCAPTETCNAHSGECFVNGLIQRAGSPGVPLRVSAAPFCIPATSSVVVNNTLGLPGPGALTQPATTIETGF